MDPLTLRPDLSDPLPASDVVRHTLESVSFVGSAVAAVLPGVDGAEVGSAVVEPVAVDVVDDQPGWVTQDEAVHVLGGGLLGPGGEAGAVVPGIPAVGLDEGDVLDVDHG